jgi:hypothetical protein
MRFEFINLGSAGCQAAVAGSLAGNSFAKRTRFCPKSSSRQAAETSGLAACAPRITRAVSNPN